MKIALDPYMHRELSLTDTVKLAAELGYEYIELSPRQDFFDWWVNPRAYPQRVKKFKSTLKEHGVQLASLLPMYRWASPDENERQAAMRYWKRAIEIAVELECDTMNSEFGRGGEPQSACTCAPGGTSETCEASFWKSMDELVPIFEREGINLHLEPHPDDFMEDGNTAVDMIRTLNSERIKYLYCAPHTYHMGGDMAGMIHYAAPILAHVHVADTLDPRASSGNRYIVNPPGAEVRVHQHLDIGQGELDWNLFFKTLSEVGFDGIMTVCVFAWEDRAVESSRSMRETVQMYVDTYFVK